MFEKEKKSKKQAKNGGFDHKWPKKRSLNIEQMIKRMQKDEAYLYEVAYLFLHTFSDIPWKLGDENMSIMIAWVAAQMHNKKLEAERKRPKKAKRSRR